MFLTIALKRFRVENWNFVAFNINLHFKKADPLKKAKSIIVSSYFLFWMLTFWGNCDFTQAVLDHLENWWFKKAHVK